MAHITKDAFAGISTKVQPSEYAVVKDEHMNSVSIIKTSAPEHDYDYWTLFFHGTVEAATGHVYAVFEANYAADYTSRKKPTAKLWYVVGNQLMGYHRNGEYAGTTLRISEQCRDLLVIPDWA